MGRVVRKDSGGGKLTEVTRWESINFMKKKVPPQQSDDELYQLSKEELVETIKAVSAEIARLKDNNQSRQYKPLQSRPPLT